MKKFVLSCAMLCMGTGHLFAADLTDPAEILQRCQAAYKNCATCKVEGDYRSVFGPAGKQTQDKGINLLFSRSDRLFRFDWTETDAQNTPSIQSIFTHEGQTHFYWGKLHRHVIRKDLSEALGAAAGISSGLTSFLPQLLQGEAWPLELKDSVLRPAETLDERPCYVVAGTGHHDGGKLEVAIDKTDFSIRRVKEHYTVKAVSHEQMVDRLKATNPDLAARLAAQPPSPDFDVDAVTEYTKTVFNAPIGAADCDFQVPKDVPLGKD